MKKPSKQKAVVNTIRIGTLGQRNYGLLLKNIKSIKALPFSIPSDKKGCKKSISKFIEVGSDLDHIFSCGTESSWNYYITEEIILNYQRWVYNVFLLLQSEHAIKNNWRLKYPTLSDNDGVSGSIELLANPDAKITNKGMRFGVGDDADHASLGKEGISQFKNAHASLKRKIVALSEVFKEGFSSKRDTASTFYIIKVGDDYKYNGDTLADIAMETDYYKTFDTLYSFLPEGGVVTYLKLGSELKRRIKKISKKPEAAVTKFIQSNLTDTSNGFLHYAKIPNTIPGGKKLIRANRGKRGIEFNNRKGG